MTDRPDATVERNPARTVIGIVVSDKMEKTITVQEDRLAPHPKYGKYLKRGTTYKAHDEKEVAKEGDTVEIVQSRPLSKTKRWRLVRIVRAGGIRAVTGEEDREAAAPPPKKPPPPPKAADEAGTAGEEASS
jgi:small subunit ribosomal protein S17